VLWLLVCHVDADPQMTSRMVLMSVTKKVHMFVYVYM
jgi:hypothetical protein